MKALKFVVAAAVAVGLAAAVVWSVLSALRWVVAWIPSQSSQVGAAYIAFAGTVIAGIGAVVISQQRTKSREIAESHRPMKIELYQDFIDQVLEVLESSKANTLGDPDVQADLAKGFFKFTSRVMLWGSPSVLSKYSAFRGGAGDPTIVLLVDDVLQAMRKDLGLSNWGLQRGDLVKLLISDPENLDVLMSQRVGS